MSLISLLLSLLLSMTSAAAGEVTPLQQADAAYAEKSFSRAHDLYAQALKGDLTAEQRRWVELRLADTVWRAEPENENRRAEARAAVEELLRKWGEPHDRLWAEAEEVLGDIEWLHRGYQRNLGDAQRHYGLALDWWAGSRDIPAARRRYLDMVWKIASVADRWQPMLENAHSVPREVLLNALQIAETPADRAHARYLLAQQLIAESRPESIERAYELLEGVIAEGKRVEQYDDALFLYASTLMQNGVVVVTDDGNTTSRPDFVKALELLKRLVAEFSKSQTPYFERASDAIAMIVRPSLNVVVSHTFLPDSEQEIALDARNVGKVDISIIPIDLTREKLDSAAVGTRKPLRRWTEALPDQGDHSVLYRVVRIAPKLDPGAYAIDAAGGGTSSRRLLLVTDAHVLAHQVRGRIDAYVSNVLTGEPIAGARVRAVFATRERDVTSETVVDAEAKADGIAQIALPRNASGYYSIYAAKGSRQAWLGSYGYWGGNPETDLQWRIYAFTDRPAYRPGETVQWKIVARTRRNDDWQTPSGATLEFDIQDARGQKVKSGRPTLNDFGSFWSELPLTESMALGPYSIIFRSGDRQIGYAQLFRLEEYKLPEFRVSVTTPVGRQYRTGETIEAVVEASYYFGGPVANAEVQVSVFQEPFRRHWYPWREYPWYYDELPSYGYGTEVKRETLRTDANGRVTVTVDTPRDRGDLTYRIEANVTDSSRREVRGEGSVRVMRHRYSVMATPAHYLHRPGDKIAIDFKALDANDKPLQVTGTVTVVRKVMAPPMRPPRRTTTVASDETVQTTRVTTDKDGEAHFVFTADREGYYTVRWSSEDRNADKPLRASDLVTAETAVWVTRTTSSDIGYASSDLDIVIDKEAFRSGETAPVLITAPSSGRWVMVTTSANDVLDTQLVCLDGTVKLIEVPLGARHVPNFFITASSVFERRVSTLTRSVVVPPVEHFIDVEVQGDREEYEPRQKGTITITTRDADGKPVPAEVALSVSDEAVTAIQQDLAGDPRQFFFGERRYPAIQVSASVNGQTYARLVEVDGRLYEEGVAEQVKRERDEAAPGRRSGNLGAVAGEMAPPPAPPPAPVAQSRMAKNAVAEAITVAASAPAVADAMAAADASQVVVRSDFRSTAFWKPDVITDANGTATVTIDYPEALTTWRATARAASKGAQFGMGSSTARTNMPLIVRLQGPRFFVAGDRATVSAVLNNNTDAAMRVTPSIEVEGLTLTEPNANAVDVPARGEARVDWSVSADRAGNAKIRVAGRGPTRSDAMERTFIVYEHGIDKLVARSGRMRGNETIVKLDLPSQRRATELVVTLQPDLAVTMLDALPYLVEFPYGCTEQTMSRFLPAAVVAKTLAAYSRELPVPKNLDAVTAASMTRLYDFQQEDGGWGWWKESDSDTFMTAYVVWGFAVARDAGLRGVRTDAIERAVQWLDGELGELEKRDHDAAWVLHALAAWRRGAPTADEKKAFDGVYERRDGLSPYSRALLALAAHDFGLAAQAKVLVRNLEDGVKVDRTPDQSILVPGGSSTAETMATAHWGSDRFWWRWWEGPIETTAFALQAILRIDPENKLVEPVTNWIVKNRRGSRWSNTRDTAIAILALLDRRPAAVTARVPYEVLVNGKSVAKGSIDALHSAKIAVDPALVRDANEITIRSPQLLYFAAEGRFVSLEEPVKAAGNELFVKREYFRLVPHPTLLKGFEMDKLPLRDGESIASGERIEVVVTIETKNDYEYLVFEDLKPAGFEAIDLQSGEDLYATARDESSEPVYRELRDRKVAMFVDRLAQGVWEIRYTLRAETPGRFHALPLLGHAMYVPDIRANGDEARVGVE